MIENNKDSLLTLLFLYKRNKNKNLAKIEMDVAVYAIVIKSFIMFNYL